MYKILLSKQAKKYYSNAEHSLTRRINEWIDKLSEDPFQSGCRPLTGSLSGKWRVRIGGIRIIYEVYEEPKIVRLVKIGPRGDVYK